MSDESTFIGFLRTGQLRGVKLGDSGDSVRAALGPPEETSPTGRGGSIWAYSGRLLQLYLDGGRVVFIGLYVRYESRRLPYTDDDIPVSAGSTAADLLALLNRAGISYRVGGPFEAKFSIGDAGVSAYLTESGHLDSFQLALRA